MKSIKEILIAIGLSLAFAVEAEAEINVRTDVNRLANESMLKLESLEVSHIGNTLQMSMVFNSKAVRLGSNRQVVFTPVICSLDSIANYSVSLDPIIIAGRNRYYSYLRNGEIAEGANIYRAGKNGKVEYSRCIPWGEWMENAYIYMREETKDCCRQVKPHCDTPIAKIAPLPAPSSYLPKYLSYVPLTGDSTIEMEVQGRAYIDFMVNNCDINERYRNNRQELEKIINSINLIKNDSDATITRLSIKGFASPEGSYANNARLAMGRTEALKEYVKRKNNFNSDIMMTSYEPEDWVGLRNWLENSSLPQREEIIKIVDSDLEADAKENAIKRQFPRQYKIMLDSVYPSLRHSDYTVRYTIRTYSDISDLKRLFNDAPDKLRPVDFYRVAEAYPEGSENFESVLLCASEIYPFDEEASINAANILIKRGELERASKKLVNAGDSGKAYLSRGILAALSGDNNRAEIFLSRAAELGEAQAPILLERLRQDKERETISYLFNIDKQH